MTTNTSLIVVTPFASHKKGEIISDQNIIATILASQQARFVRRITIPVSTTSKNIALPPVEKITVAPIQTGASQ